ncbi:hypothetical protein EDD21DRAFT_401992 [Dissophora ornata]|nr:hypothetical protein EDD21DRAFT_401992 [Dissophora ornata]
MSKINPLDQPEIKLLIGEHLRGVDLVRCLRVCWSWHNTFLPLVWDKVSVGKTSWEPPSQDSLTPEVLGSHRHLIKDLRIVDWQENNPFVFPRMHTLDFHLFNGTTPSLAKYLAPLIGRNQSLVKLHFWNIDKDIDYRLWKALLKLPHLRELSLGMLHIQEDDIVSKSLGEGELRWMLVHWKDLNSVSADVDIDDDTKIELRNLLKSRDIKLRR